jgi:hypothetical protein
MTILDDPRCSPFALDVHWASREPPDAALAEHLAGCERCRAYLAGLRAFDADRPVALLGVGPRAESRVAGSMRWVLPLAGGLAIAACMLVFLNPRHDGYVGAKGTPAVELMVRRGGDTAIWDGNAAVHPGDAIAVRVACEGLSHVAVAAPQAENRGWTRLADADCPTDPASSLPFTLVVDEQPGDEHFVVVLSRAALDDAAIRSAAADVTRTADLWTVRFDVPKSLRAPR